MWGSEAEIKAASDPAPCHPGDDPDYLLNRGCLESD